MPSSIQQALKAEIERISRKQIRAELKSTKKAVARYRGDIAELKRTVKGLEWKLASLENEERRRLARRPSAKLAEGARFSATRLKGHRERLGLSQADYALLVGVSSPTIYNWENQKTRPRKEQLAALVSVRGLRKREAQKRLQILKKKAG